MVTFPEGFFLKTDDNERVLSPETSDEHGRIRIERICVLSYDNILFHEPAGKAASLNHGVVTLK